MGNKATGAQSGEDADSLEDNLERRVVLLGAGDTGKTAFYRHTAAITHPNAFKTKDRCEFLFVVRYSIFSTIQHIAKHIIDNSVPVVDKDKILPLIFNIQQMGDILPININTVWNDALVRDMTRIWKNSTVQHVFANRHILTHSRFSDSIQYYMEFIDDINEEDYIPTVLDIILTKTKTTGITEQRIRVKNSNFTLFDVGGQRNERKKWPYIYGELSCVVFTVSLIEYASLCCEDDLTNRAWESVSLFKEIVNLPNFANVPFVLAFTKVDLLPHTITRSRFGSVFPRFTGRDYECVDIIMYLKDLFIEQYDGAEEDKIVPVVLNVTDATMMGEALKTMVNVAKSGSTKDCAFHMYNPSKRSHMFDRNITTLHNDITLRMRI